MNYLAHLYLSGTDEKVIVGNFIGDYVKGKRYMDYPDGMSSGILLHRKIDSYTDKHPKFREAKNLFRSDYRLFSGIVVDFVYDHMLAMHWREYSGETLRSFAKRINAILLSHFRYLPRRVQGFLPFLIQNKRLESYATVDGIIQSLKIMSNYSSVPQKSEVAKEIMLNNYAYLADNFRVFMADMIQHVKEISAYEMSIGREQLL